MKPARGSGTSTTDTRRTGKDPTVVFINRHGGTFYPGTHAGDNDSSRNISSIVRSSGEPEVTIPPSTRDDEYWRFLMTCVETKFAGFNVDFTTKRPARGPYILVSVGGDPAQLHRKKSTGGVAPRTNTIIDDGVVFAFERGNVEKWSQCSTIAHELGHVMGLDHSYLEYDIMGMSNPKKAQFHNQSEPCGHNRPRACRSGEQRQNSYQHLVRTLGLRRGVAPRTANQTPRTFHVDHEGPCGSDSRPTMNVEYSTTGFRDRVAAGKRWVVRVEASDPDGIKSVSVHFDGVDGPVHYACGQRSPHASCTRDGKTYVFSARLPPGEQLARVRATDGLGHDWTHHKLVVVER